MNRIELLFILLMLATGVVFIIKSKWFDKAIDWLISGVDKSEQPPKDPKP